MSNYKFDKAMKVKDLDWQDDKAFLEYWDQSGQGEMSKNADPGTRQDILFFQWVAFNEGRSYEKANPMNRDFVDSY